MPLCFQDRQTYENSGPGKDKYEALQEVKSFRISCNLEWQAYNILCPVADVIGCLTKSAL